MKRIGQQICKRHIRARAPDFEIKRILALHVKLCEMAKSCRRVAYLGQGNVGDDDGIHGARGGAEGLVLVTVRVVLVFVNLAVLLSGMPWHGTLADANVALGVDGGGLASEVPGLSQTSAWSANCTV